MKKRYSQFYKQSKKVQFVDVPEMIYLTVCGSGNPNTSKEFQRAIELLYKFSYKVRMSYKSTEPIPNFEMYTVGPLEGFWTTVDNQEYDNSNKDNLKFKLIINQPAFFTKDIFDKYQQELLATSEDFKLVNYELITEGKCVQIMHVGSFDSEPESVDLLIEECKAKNLEILKPSHHEIYLSDFRKVDEDKLKTILRYKVQELK